MTFSGPSPSVHPVHPLLNDVQDMVEKLRHLVELLLPPDPTVPYIITYTRIKELFRLTGLGAPAMDTIAQTQRISRTTGDYEQIGLCEFHIGLIFLFWGQCQAAAKQFAQARVQWQFVDATPLQCLARFAEGTALHFAFVHEEAMVRYRRTENCLPRMRFVTPSDNLGRFLNELQALLQTMMTRLQEEMEPEPEVDQPRASSIRDTQTTATAVATPPASSSEIPNPPATDTPARTSGERVPPPYIGSRLPEGSQPPATTNKETPIPSHHKDNSHLKWYYVQDRINDDFLPQIRPGSWVLVDDRVQDHAHQNEELVIIQNGHLEGSLPLFDSSEKTAQAPFRRIYLAQFNEPVDTNHPINFDRDPHTGRVTFAQTKRIPVQETEIVGIVVGFWRLAELVNKP